jgi:peptide deformylase
MKLIYYPNPVLIAPTETVTIFDHELKQITTSMTEVMLKYNGIGLAAPQIGLSKKIFVMKDHKGNIHEFINPKIVNTDFNIVMREGCLSAPGIYLEISRASAVVLQYQNIDGEDKKIIAEGLEARCIQHELEHLNQDFYFNRVNRSIRKIAISKMKKNGFKE